jgi:L-amino acid N-acyltransferase YncA
MRNGLRGIWWDETVTLRPARIEDAPQIARVHVDSWRAKYSGIMPEDFLAAMSHEDFEVRWHGWLGGESGVRATLWVVESSAGKVVGFASGGPRRDESYPRYESELYTVYPSSRHQRRGLGRRLLGMVAGGLSADGKRLRLAWVSA